MSQQFQNSGCKQWGMFYSFPTYTQIPSCFPSCVELYMYIHFWWKGKWFPSPPKKNSNKTPAHAILAPLASDIIPLKPLIKNKKKFLTQEDRCLFLPYRTQRTTFLIQCAQITHHILPFILFPVAPIVAQCASNI